MPVRLIPIAAGKPIKLDKPVVLIGRDPDCDVILTRSRKVSRAHCIVACVENSVVVRDLGSTNGVWLNGHRVERESSMRLGDELSIADVRYQLLNVERTNGNSSSAEIPVVKDKRKKKRKKDRKERKSRREAKVISPADRIDEDHELRLRNSELKPIDMSQNVPVAIPEQDDSFVVEASMPRLPKPSALAKLEEEAGEPPPRRRRSRRRDPDDSSCDVIPLANQSPPTDEAIPIVDSDEIIEIDEPLGANLLANQSPPTDEAIPVVDSDEIIEIGEPLDANPLEAESSNGKPLIPLDDSESGSDI